ncbi:helix-turn-helix domain-containing protein [Azonexus sp. IMCC34839]|uniref:helix-turn-helix domain-containing protein n=1 Tax=Azonexus sp. IMCC34839 TaxID=3133695 RepID=UPI00399AAA62
MSKTQQALSLVAQGKTVREAAAKAGITEPTLYAALKRIKEQSEAGKERCPCCGQVVREGFEINRDVLK